MEEGGDKERARDFREDGAARQAQDYGSKITWS